MIDYLIREERQGGYFAIRKEGRCVEVNEPGYRLLRRAHGQQDYFTEAERHRWETEFAACGQDKLLELLHAQGLDRPKAWASVRHVPSDVPLGLLPTDAAAAPKRIYFEITHGCNLSCRSCFNNSHQSQRDELTLEEILAVNRQAYELGVFEIRYTGGECTTFPKFDEVIADARRRGFYISIGTNGVYNKEQLAWLPYCGIDWFIISLDGDQKVHDSVRGDGTFRQVLRTLSVLSTLPVRLRINMTVAKHNVASIECVARLAAEFGVESVNLIPLRPYGRAAKTMCSLMFNGAEYYEYVREISRLRSLYPGVEFITAMDLDDPRPTTSRDLIVQKRQTCAAGVEACVIGPQGHVFGCSYSPASFPDHATTEETELFIPGNIRTEPLHTIWRDSRRWKVFRNLRTSKNEKCLKCDHYKVRCTGSCQIMSYYERKRTRDATGGRAELSSFQDPYCPRDAFDLQTAASSEVLCSSARVT